MGVIREDKWKQNKIEYSDGNEIYIYTNTTNITISTYLHND